MNKGETLVILTPGFPRNEADTVCLPLQQSLVRSLKEIHPTLNIVVLSFQYPYETNQYIWYGIPVIPFGGRNKGGLSRLLLRKKVNARLNEINSASKITGLLSFWYNECALVGKRFADKNGIRHFCWILGQDAKKENKYPGKIRPTPDELLALSDFIQDEFERNHGVRPGKVMPPGIDTKEFPASPMERDIDLLAVGSLIPLKQYEIFIEIVADLNKQLPDLKVMLVGHGTEKGKLERLITKFGLESAIKLAGELPHPEVLQLMQRAKVFLHPSSYEGFGVVCLEALYGGASVISFVKPMRRVIKNWYIVRTIEEMKEKAMNILHNPDKLHYPVLPFLLSDCVKAIGDFFG